MSEETYLNFSVKGHHIHGKDVKDRDPDLKDSEEQPESQPLFVIDGRFTLKGSEGG